MFCELVLVSLLDAKSFGHRIDSDGCFRLLSSASLLLRLGA